MCIRDRGIIFPERVGFLFPLIDLQMFFRAMLGAQTAHEMVSQITYISDTHDTHESN